MGLAGAGLAEILIGRGTVIFFHRKCVAKMEIRSPKRRVREYDVVVELSIFSAAIHGVSGVIFGVVLPCIINEVVYVMRLNHKIHFVLQAQYLVKLWCEVCGSVYCK